MNFDRNEKLSGDTSASPLKRRKLDAGGDYCGGSFLDGKDVLNSNMGNSEDKERLHRILESLSPEVWDTIFEYLVNPEDKLKLLNTCGSWYSLLVSKRTSILFPLVLPLLVPYLPVAAILCLRLVCKRWKSLISHPVETYRGSSAAFETHWWHIASPFATLLTRLQSSYTLQSPSKVVQLSNHLANYPTSRNPFISRHISFEFPTGNEFPSSHSVAVNFLQAWGSHLYSLNHYCPDLTHNEINSITTLPSLLNLTPNLRSLKIEWYSDDHLLNTVPELRQLLDTPPKFPSLPNLTDLDYRGGDSQELLLAKCLLPTYGRTLTSLTLRGNYLEAASLSSSLLPALVNFRLFFVTTRSLRQLASYGLPLERLILWYSFQSIDISCILTSISAFAQTLRHLHLDLKIRSPLVDYFMPSTTPQFSQLTHLSSPVSSLNSPWFTQFLKKCPNLTHLTLQTAMESMFVPYERKHLHKEISASKDLFSNFPRLKRILFWFHNEGSLTLTRGNC